MHAHDCGYLCVFANHSPGWAYCSPFTKTTTSSAGKARHTNGLALLLLTWVPCAQTPLWFVFACSRERGLARLPLAWDEWPCMGACTYTNALELKRILGGKAYGLSQRRRRVCGHQVGRIHILQTSEVKEYFRYHNKV